MKILSEIKKLTSFSLGNQRYHSKPCTSSDISIRLYTTESSFKLGRLSRFQEGRRNIVSLSKQEYFPQPLASNKYLHPYRQMSTVSGHELALRRIYRPRDIEFKTPHGRVAALEWGHKSAPHKILCVHGWLDNAGSFERLVPFILDDKDNSNLYHIVSIDTPGVGLSSHRPPGADYSTFSFIIEMRRVTQQLKWDKLTLLTHSFGAHLAFLYSCIYNGQVETMISIDLAQPIARANHNWHISIANSIEDNFKCDYQHEDDPTTNIRVPVYSEVDAIKRLMDGHSSSLTKESAEILLKRGAKKQRWGYTFSRDIRLRHLSAEFRPDDDTMLNMIADPFRPNLLIIRALRSPYHRPEDLRMKYYKIFEKNCPIFRDVMLDGTHHLHLNNPELVAPEICKFLSDVLAKGNSVASIGNSKL